jgi:hypothetical protein
MVDTGTESTWINATALESLGIERREKDLQFQLANGQGLCRCLRFPLAQSSVQLLRQCVHGASALVLSVTASALDDIVTFSADVPWRREFMKRGKRRPGSPMGRDRGLPKGAF